jgi:predicted nucleotidyltransferase
MVSQDQIQQLVKEIAEGYQPEKIYLFGSYANGTPNKDSDLDFFIIKKTSVRKIQRGGEVRATFKKYPPVGVDVIVYTPEELVTVQNYTVNIAKEAIKTGKLLYERS